MVWRKNKDKWSTKYSDKHSTKSIRKFNIKKPNVNKSLLLLLSLIVALFVLCYLNFKSGNYVKVLEQNITSLKSQTSECGNETEELTSNLNSCDTELESKATSLDTCNNEKEKSDSLLQGCEDELSSCYKTAENKDNLYSTCQDSLNSLQNDLNNLRNNRNDCEDSLADANSNYNSLAGNYAKSKCCPLNKTYYSISGNNIVCQDSNGTSISC
jgi:DNA repair exonuclease SbcCD ATPase subunit